MPWEQNIHQAMQIYLWVCLKDTHIVDGKLYEWIL